jgi:hypothetical protein
VTTAEPTTAGSVSQWVTAQAEVEDPENPDPSGSSKKPVRVLELHFALPCGNGQPYGTEGVVLKGPKNQEFKIRDVVVGKNPDSLEAFINEHYNDVSELAVSFRMGKSPDDDEARKQLLLCLKALVPLVTQCSFLIYGEYTMASRPEKKYDQDGISITLGDIIIGRFKKLAGHMPELKVRC